jgi:hypothetical protein
MTHPNKRAVIALKTIKWFQQLYPGNLVLSNLYELNWYGNQIGQIVHIKRTHELPPNSTHLKEELSEHLKQFRDFYSTIGVIMIYSTRFKLKSSTELNFMEFSPEFVFPRVHLSFIIWNSLSLKMENFVKVQKNPIPENVDWMSDDMIRVSQSERFNEFFQEDY